MGASLFTLELIADALCGSAGNLAAAMLTSAPVPTQQGAPGLRLTGAAAPCPSLGLRLLDLAPALVDALDGEVFRSAPESRIAFGGRGKALVFELPESSVWRCDKGEHGVLQTPMPLLLMALARPPEAGAAAVLLASACVDLRQEVMHAALDGHGGGASACCPFKRLAFQMTSARDASCTLTLRCFLRLYAGGGRPISGGELLLEPNAVAPAPLPAPLPAELGGVAGERRSVETQTETLHESDAKRHESEPTSAATEHMHSRSRHQSHRHAAGDCFSNDVQSGDRCGVYFPSEIVMSCPETRNVGPMGGIATPECLSSLDLDTGNADSVAVCGGPAPGQTPDVASSLPLVSKLLRELWQVRSVT